MQINDGQLVLDTRYTNKEGTYPIAIRVRSGKQLKHPPTGYKVPPSAWGKGEVKKSYPNSVIINADIADQLAAVKNKLLHAQRAKITALAQVLHGEDKATSFTAYLSARATQYEQSNKGIFANRTRRLALDLQHCFGKQAVDFDLQEDDLTRLYVFLKKTNKPNTIHNKFKHYRQAFGKAVKAKKTNAINPFDNFKVPTSQVHKEKLTKEELKKVEELPLLQDRMNDARNLFLFSYYCKGMRFEDCVRVRRADVSDEYIIFRDVRKSHKLITVKMHARLKKLIEPYLGNKVYLFPFLKQELAIDKTGVSNLETERERKSKVGSQNTIVNRLLELIMSAAGIRKKITMHNARHTTAQHLKQQKTHISVIQQVLGHSNQHTTEMYLKDLENEEIDDAMTKLYED